MGTFILIVVVLFIIVLLAGFVSNKNKEKKYEKIFTKDVIKTKKLYKGSLTRYIIPSEEKTILRYFISGKTNTIKDFIPDDEILVNYGLILFDRQRRKMSIIQDINKHGITTTIPFSDIISLEPIEISKTKKITRGGISPIAINGYRWASVTTKNLKQIERVYIEIKYKAYNKENTCDVTVFNGISYEDRGDYSLIVEEVNRIINKIHDTVTK